MVFLSILGLFCSIVVIAATIHEKTNKSKEEYGEDGYNGYGFNKNGFDRYGYDYYGFNKNSQNRLGDVASIPLLYDNNYSRGYYIDIPHRTFFCMREGSVLFRIPLHRIKWCNVWKSTKTVSNGFSTGLRDGALSAITGVGIIRSSSSLQTTYTTGNADLEIEYINNERKYDKVTLTIDDVIFAEQICKQINAMRQTELHRKRYQVVVSANSSENTSTPLKTISRRNPIIFHVGVCDLHDAPNVNLSYRCIHTNGSVSQKKNWSTPFKENAWHYCGWYGDDCRYKGDTGFLIIEIFNSDTGELVGSQSVGVTE